MLLRFGALASLIMLSASWACAQTLAERGAYLVNGIMACGLCHTPRGPNGPALDRSLSGGVQIFATNAYKAQGGNITPDRETGIGTWKDEQIRQVLLKGVRPDGIQLAPAMPYQFYGALSTRDQDAVISFLKTVKPVRNEILVRDYISSFETRAFPGAERPIEEAQQRTPAEHGRYLALLAHCNQCHTTGENGHYDMEKRGQGGREFRGPWGISVARNITTSDSGLGAWSDDEIKRAITQGLSKDGSRLKPPMPYSSYARLTPEDLSALVAWLRAGAN